jgi:indole-3-glycerol phosphate synthase
MIFKNQTVLDKIVARVKRRLADDKSRWPVEDLKKRIADARPTASFWKALSGSFGLIAEIKKCSPSQGKMRHQDASDIANTYQDHSFVRAVSVLTNRDDFGMNIKDLESARRIISKPILRKDFVFDEYQVFEARAYGADAILLMANILTDPARMRGLFDLSQDLEMDVLFECRSEEEINAIPSGAKIYGINSRKLKAATLFGIDRYLLARKLRHFGVSDRSVEHAPFDLASRIPSNALKVAESGLRASEISRMRDTYHYNAALVGTAILNSTSGIKSALDSFAGISDTSHIDIPAASGTRRLAV